MSILNNGYGLATFNDLYSLFERVEVDGEMAHASVPSFDFYAKDYRDFNVQVEENSEFSNNLEVQYLSVITNSPYDFKNDDWVYSWKDECYWRILNYTIADDNTSKKYSSRPRKLTILNLVRNGVDEDA